jgi:hypothetical protein
MGRLLIYFLASSATVEGHYQLVGRTATIVGLRLVVASWIGKQCGPRRRD